MPKKAGKLTIYQEESKMTATLTLNDLTIEQASAVLSLVEEMQKADKPVTPEEARNGVEIFAPPAPAEALAEETEEEPAYTIEQVRAAFTKYAKQNGKEAAKKLLEKFGAGKVTELKPEDYAAVMKGVS
jgi:hypothetical protein